MFSASRIGTPDCTSVPRVRIVRATVDFSTIVPMTGIISKIRSQDVGPGPVAVEQLDEDPDRTAATRKTM